MLTDVAAQVKWSGEYRTKSEWKILMMSAINKVDNIQASVVPGLEGDIVCLLDSGTSKISKTKFITLIEYIFFFGTTNNVEWSRKSDNAYDTYLEIYEAKNADVH